MVIFTYCYKDEFVFGKYLKEYLAHETSPEGQIFFFFFTISITIFIIIKYYIVLSSMDFKTIFKNLFIIFIPFFKKNKILTHLKKDWEG